MSTIEIILLVIGIIMFVVSFILPEKKKALSTNEMCDAEEAVKNCVNQEMDRVRGRMEDVIDETITYSMEKTERTLDRLTNEKMMAVNEYSDTVLENIHKNHDEVMFLYDMLNQKQQSLKQSSLHAQELLKEMEEKKAIRKEEQSQDKVLSQAPEGKTQTVPIEEINKIAKPKKIMVKKKAEAEIAKEETSAVDIPFTAGVQNGSNSNEKILALHKDGKSKMVIAKELGLGVGEVKLVIDLFEGV